MLRSNAKPFRGQRVRLRAAVRVETHDPEGGARLIMETETGQFDEIDVGSMSGPAIASPEWKEYELTLDVAPRAADLRFGLAVTGDASAWLDSVEVIPVGASPSPEH